MDSMFVFFLLFLCQVVIPIDGAAPTFVDSDCKGGDFNYTKNSTYEKNLNLVLSEIAPHASVVKFYNLTGGEGDNTVYSLFQCRQDVSLDVCSSCMKDATKKILVECPLYGEAIVWYDECTLRYAKRNIFSLMESSPTHTSWFPTNASNINRFIIVLGETMDGVIRDASASTPSGHFATREANLTFPQKLYCLAQCTPDISTFDCNSCLRNALALISGYCTGCTSGENLSPSCQLRYSSSPFYGESARAPPATISPRTTEKKSKTPIIAGIVAAATVGLLLPFAGIWVCTHRKKAKEPPIMVPTEPSKESHDDQKNYDGNTEFVQYDFSTLKTATGDFSNDNKLGEGGFGAVYKGVLKTGQILAIKRLSGDSGQGVKEFTTEAHIVAQLQHKNLVKLTGVCSSGDEKLLIYEFMPNTSLDYFLFDPTKRALLEWNSRSQIIIGVAKGLQYLHEDSRITIIHRDLKTSNILLDVDMNAKIADFGLAKLFGAEQNYGNTSRIVGTYGYMAPEYMLQGEYSEKSDVYSFGIIILEIVSGQKNRVHSQASHKEDLPIYTWSLWKAGQALEIMDRMLFNKCSTDEVMRCIQIALLCVQGNPANRPTMGRVVLMLNGLVAIPTPSSPAMDLRLPMNDNDYGLQDGSVLSNTQSVTWSNTQIKQDLYPR